LTAVVSNRHVRVCEIKLHAWLAEITKRGDFCLVLFRHDHHQTVLDEENGLPLHNPVLLGEVHLRGVGRGEDVGMGTLFKLRTQRL